MVETIIQRLSQQASDFSGLSGSFTTDEDLISQGLSRSDLPIDALGTNPSTTGEGLTYFTTPISDLLIEIFELKTKNKWLRRGAIVIVLQTMLGGTIERKFRDILRSAVTTDLAQNVRNLKDSVWPGGKLRQREPPRTPQQKAATKSAAYDKFVSLVPDLAASLIGRSNARRGARRIFAVLQNKRLNQHLVYSLLDEIVQCIFPELDELT